ncbi:hypothetical protein GWI33_013423 [Rhynchophorus ferrugineus]|uniref:Uncharacterized protein n=1 Tax=Rhynchophorus ferrugineus TaxID=354439 RepID=A0A834I753_RHYFE|nr:hypothetical protein GWI33_013423 [Rhynchophorus ferrugineus]
MQTYMAETKEKLFCMCTKTCTWLTRNAKTSIRALKFRQRVHIRFQRPRQTHTGATSAQHIPMNQETYGPVFEDLRHGPIGESRRDPGET